MEFIGQILGLIAVVFACISYQAATQKGLLLTQTAAAGTITIHYALIGSYDAIAMSVFSVIRNFIYYDKKHFSWKYWPLVLTAVMLLFGILSWKSPATLLLIIGWTINSYALSFSDPQKTRKTIFVSSPCVLAYNILSFSIGGIILESLSLISAIVGLIRYRKAEKITQ